MFWCFSVLHPLILHPDGIFAKYSRSMVCRAVKPTLQCYSFQCWLKESRTSPSSKSLTLEGLDGTRLDPRLVMEQILNWKPIWGILHSGKECSIDMCKEIFLDKKSTLVGLSSSPMALSGPIGMAWHSHRPVLLFCSTGAIRTGSNEYSVNFSFRHGKSCDNNHRKVLHSQLADGSVRKVQSKKNTFQLQFRMAARPLASTVSNHLLMNKS